MDHRSLALALAVLLGVSNTALAGTQPVRDHLACFKVKSSKPFDSATVNLDALLGVYDLTGCSLKPKVALYCVPVDKSVTLVGGTPLDVEGATDALESLCYKVKCPKTDRPTDTFSDQFGTHALTKFKPSVLCAPAVQGTPVTTTTLPCIPAAEVCNNVDDDCDEMVDEDLGMSSCGVGACQRTVSNCAGGMPQSCVPGSASAETCDGLDNDCDGQTDEDLGNSNCGVGACARTVANCSGGSPQSCTPGSPDLEICDNLDNDCDGQVDESLGNSSCGVGACFRTVPNCSGGVPQSCTPGTPESEVCGDGIDNDCNGVADDGC